MTPQEAYELAKKNTNLQAQQEKNKVVGEGTSYNPLERTAFENIVQQNAMNKGLASANQLAPLNNANLQGNLASGDAVQNEFDYQRNNPYVSGGSANNPQVFQRTGGLNQQASEGGGFTPGVTLGGIGVNPGQTTSFTNQAPGPIPVADKTEIPIGDVKKKEEKVIVQDKKGNEVPLKDTDKIVVKRGPEVNLFDFLEAAASGAGRNPNKNTALNQRMAEYYNKLDAEQKALVQQQYAEKMAALQNQYDIDKLNRQYQWELALRKQQLNPYNIPPDQYANIMAQQLASGGGGKS